MSTPANSPFYLSESLFFLHPIEFYAGNNQAPMLPNEKIDQIVREIDKYIDTSSTEKFEKSGCIYWLTHSLHCAAAAMHTGAIQKIATVMMKIAVKDAKALIRMLDKVIRVDEYKGQHATYVWINQLYLATFDVRNYTATDTTIISIQCIFAHLFTTAGDELAASFAKTIQQGSDSGKNALLVIAQALVQAAKKSRHPPTTLILAEFLHKCISKSPDVLGLEATNEINEGTLQGKSVIYMMAYALRYAVVDNIDATKLIVNCLKFINIHHHHPFVDSLFKIIELGPHKGLHPFNILLTALVSASYIKDNADAVTCIVNFIQPLIETDPNILNLVCTETILTGEYTNTNGIMMLERASKAASSHHINPDPIESLISSFNVSDTPLPESPNKLVNRNRFHLDVEIQKVEHDDSGYKKKS